LLLAIALLTVACGDLGGLASGVRQREWTELQRSKRALDADRRELTRLRGRLAAAPVGLDGAPVGDEAVALADAVHAQEHALAVRSATLEQRLVRHIAAFKRRAGTPASPALQQAIRMKSDEDIEVAQEWIERGGDYRRAIEILETQRPADPVYARLQQALSRAQEMRYVTAERFGHVQPGMTGAEVRATLGPVNLHNVLRRPAERVEAWFYPRVAGRAGVYFRYDAQRRAFVVYDRELDARGVVAARPAATS
jgi:hypothetical protein